VIHVAAEGAVEPRLPCQRVAFTDFRSLDAALQRALATGSVHAIVHLAAVSDYSVAGVAPTGAGESDPDPSRKLESDADLILRLRRNFKIVSRLKEYAARGPGRAFGPPRLVAFKLTHTASPEERARAVARLGEDPSIDLIVHNDLHDRARTGRHEFSLHRRGREGRWEPVVFPLDLTGLARELISELKS
jgi:hypothetical protein